MLKKTLLFFTLGLTVTTQMLLLTLTAMAKPAGTIQSRTIQLVPSRHSLLRFKAGIRDSRKLEDEVAQGKCCIDEINAAIPPKSRYMKAKYVPVEVTLSDRPTIFVNVPQTYAKQEKFLLRDEKDQVLLEKTLTLTARHGIMAYTLPADFAGLEVGKKYSWRFSLLCDPNGSDRSGDVVTGGWIERVQPNATVTQQLQTASKAELVRIYAANGYWYDTLKVLADLRATNPNNPSLMRDWLDLFQSVGLNAIAYRPVVPLNPYINISGR